MHTVFKENLPSQIKSLSLRESPSYYSNNTIFSSLVLPLQIMKGIPL